MLASTLAEVDCRLPGPGSPQSGSCGRCGCCCCPSGLEAEAAAARGDDWGVVLLDQLKCFDRLIREVVFRLEQLLGMPAWVTEGSRQFYKQLRVCLVCDGYAGD